ncbi:GreA/GreB family elongation factor [Candidatus Gromoviella agglomerans]|uniref:GreA/GreB family elongation factor n=1 Tax=Candidatus Gromoviella agglomerans TaxID=2806609 RepID=UPI001E5F1867|nr:transcription elongation factor GreA [Candidatus Gromoviella agglomerans]UFX98153.1 Transcription elongation factor GreA [Candidatus Gromoviella agglomerans]
MNRVPITKNGIKIIKDELYNLEQVERPEVIRAISTAREFGDFSENAEYKAAREKQRMLEKRIDYLKQRLLMADIIDTSKFVGKKNIMFGATITLRSNGDEIRYQIVGEDESDVDCGKISISSMMAKQLIGKKEGDFCSINDGTTYEIIRVLYE